MIIDIIFALIIVIAIIKGYRNGFIIAVFSAVSLFVGLAAALKLSAVAAVYLKGSFNISAKWLPVVSFIVVFVLVVLLVRLGAKALEKTAELALMGWVNRLAGITLYILLYTLIFSVVLFYASTTGILKPGTIAASSTYGWIQPWGPKVIEGIGNVIPFFKDTFHQLEDFFGSFAGDFFLKKNNLILIHC